ncbi:DNA polymerase [Microbacterium phage Pikmin]|uniref:DNA polymerase I n=3 Tax=Pikminvirus pikmin TaxID=2560596 RepID=A0A2P1CKE8_9CAUD|nr:DNA polymerase [Microbacterium phage Pikmin]AVJ51026.1 DNA polymerase I [Microbacterium phage Pajaza]AVJ51173.1 DNA polymerase I [Microbacterium phage Pikmin]AVJ51731.1 DNA polymerase I [Microbacterium phage Casey]
MPEAVMTEDVSDVLKYLRQTKSLVICDIETTALTVGKGKILCIAFAAYDRDDALVWWPTDLSHIAQINLKRGVFHNAHFDQRWLRSYGATVRTEWDTMLMAHLIDENHPVGLKALGQRLLGYEDWSEENIADLASVPREEVTEYVAKDVMITRELLKWQRRHIKKNLKPGEDPVRVMKGIMIPAIEPLTQMEDNRLPVRLSLVAKTKEKVASRIEEIERELDASIPPKDRWPNWLQKTTPKWGATNWTKWWLYEYQGAMCPSRGKATKTWPEGNPSLSQEALSKIDHPAARLLSERSTLYKNLTGFLVPLLERTTEGRVSTSFNLTGTVTGRLSSASPGDDNPGINSQQIPRDKATRNLFGEKGMAWIEADYSQLELRVAAVMANEKTMMGLFDQNEDIHTYMAKRLVRSDDITKEHRSLAKGVNFGFLYGMQSKHFANYLQESYGVIITQKEAEVFREEYFANFSGLPPWYRKQRAIAIEHGGVPNAFGRFRHLPRVYNDDYWVQENAFRQAINAPVQSTGSDFMLISLARIADDLWLRDMGAKLVTTVHDSVCLIAPYKTARKVAKRIKEIMEMADDGLKQKFFLKADVTISHYWGGEALAEY